MSDTPIYDWLCVDFGLDPLTGVPNWGITNATTIFLTPTISSATNYTTLIDLFTDMRGQVNHRAEARERWQSIGFAIGAGVFALGIILIITSFLWRR